MFGGGFLRGSSLSVSGGFCMGFLWFGGFSVQFSLFLLLGFALGFSGLVVDFLYGFQ